MLRRDGRKTLDGYIFIVDRYFISVNLFSQKRGSPKTFAYLNKCLKNLAQHTKTKTDLNNNFNSE